MQKKFVTSLVLIVLVVVLGIFIFNNNGLKETKETEKQFDTEQEALQYAKRQTPNIVDVISETKLVENEKVIIYKFKKNEEVGVGTGTLTWKNKKVVWNKNGDDTIIYNIDDKTKTDISGNVETPSGNKFKLYAGIANSKNIKIETETDDNVVPHFDQKSKIYYLLIPIMDKKS
ncbi:hypothetical protein A3863_04795 [Priestia endophytica]|uniref:hypothetical protein n=1 Tax=Priestia endophytica TaxID=135735 RepID=UPI000DCA8B20|nr:hypothetical protein [Priestia endophytica]RAS91800.1 hypothetical protein A3863_04795 [Priestia endophytica]